MAKIKSKNTGERIGRFYRIEKPILVKMATLAAERSLTRDDIVNEALRTYFARRT